jgi:hypothetical protein
MSWSTPKSESGDESPHSKGANEPEIINDISAAAAGEEAANIDATDCPEAISGNLPAANKPAAGANIREVFSAANAGPAAPWPNDRLNEIPESWGTEACGAGEGALANAPA